jgi:hypothetical protein
MVLSYFLFIKEAFGTEISILTALIEVLRNAKEPLTVSEIVTKIKPGVTKSSNPRNSISTRLNEYSNNSNQKNKNKNAYFTVVSENPLRFWLIDRVNELEMKEYPIKKNKDESERQFVENPFKQAICVIGDSGSGKSVTIFKILKEAGHDFEFIIPSSSTTGLLSQYSPANNEYEISRFGDLILEAKENPDKCYTAVFDEMHKSNVIAMINDELLQAISTKRNKDRFISLDDDIAELYNNLKVVGDDQNNPKKFRGNKVIPDNFGFIFISSKPDVIVNNSDFFNRVEIVRLKGYQEDNIKSIEDLLKLKKSESNREYVEKISKK